LRVKSPLAYSAKCIKVHREGPNLASTLLALPFQGPGVGAAFKSTFVKEERLKSGSPKDRKFFL
jgi:hypothetical protein